MRTFPITVLVRLWSVAAMLVFAPVMASAENRIENVYSIIEAFVHSWKSVDRYLTEHGVQLKQQFDFEYYATYRSGKIILRDGTVTEFHKEDRTALSKFKFTVDIDERDGCVTASDVIRKYNINFVFREMGTDESALRYEKEDPSYYLLYLGFYGKQVQCLRAIQMSTFVQLPCGFINSIQDNFKELQREKRVVK